jgi:hypothetical protein
MSVFIYRLIPCLRRDTMKMKTNTPLTETKAPTAVENFSREGLQARLYLPATTRGWQLGYIGNLQALTHDTTEAERTAFLSGAKDRLFDMGAQKVIGPIDGDTWHRYRLPLSDKSNLTFVEPSYPGFTAADFYNADMPIMATYHSSLIDDLSEAVKRARASSSDEISTDLKIRNLDLSDFDNEIVLLYEFSTRAFRKNFLYSDIDLSTFTALYHPLKGMLREELILIAQSAATGEVLAVMMAVPDPINNSLVIAKTIARSQNAPRFSSTVY